MKHYSEAARRDIGAVLVKLDSQDKQELLRATRELEAALERHGLSWDDLASMISEALRGVPAPAQSVEANSIAAQRRRAEEARAAMPAIEALCEAVRPLDNFDVVELQLPAGAVVMWYPTAAAWDFWCDATGDIDTRDGELPAFLAWLRARVGAEVLQ